MPQLKENTAQLFFICKYVLRWCHFLTKKKKKHLRNPCKGAQILTVTGTKRKLSHRPVHTTVSLTPTFCHITCRQIMTLHDCIVLYNAEIEKNMSSIFS